MRAPVLLALLLALGASPAGAGSAKMNNGHPTHPIFRFPTIAAHKPFFPFHRAPFGTAVPFGWAYPFGATDWAAASPAPATPPVVVVTLPPPPRPAETSRVTIEETAAGVTVVRGPGSRHALY